MNCKSGQIRAGSLGCRESSLTGRLTRRKLFLAGAALCALGWPLARAEQKKPVVIGWLHPGSRVVSTRGITAFKEGMAALGWKEGWNYVVEERWADGRLDRLRTLAEDLKARKPAVIVALVGAVTVAAKVAPDIPVVQAQGGDPVGRGLAVNLARPGGMVTGVTNAISEVSEKYLELLLAAAPRLRRVGFLVDRTYTYDVNIRNAHRAVEHHRVEASFAEAAAIEDIDPALLRLAKEGVEGLVVLPSAGMFIAERTRIVKFALAQRWPVVAGPRGFLEAGALITYAADSSALQRRAAYYVDRILKGANPGDLPIERPTKFELTVNLKTARALGVEISPELLFRADKVIE